MEYGPIAHMYAPTNNGVLKGSKGVKLSSEISPFLGKSFEKKNIGKERVVANVFLLQI